MSWTVLVDPRAETDLDGLPEDMRARVVRIAELMRVHGPANVGMPHVRPLAGKLWEIRATGRDGIARAIYVTASGRRIVIVHVFVKKTQKTPKREIATAKERAIDYS
jgi:phage-related protein